MAHRREGHFKRKVTDPYAWICRPSAAVRETEDGWSTSQENVPFASNERSEPVSIRNVKERPPTSAAVYNRVPTGAAEPTGQTSFPKVMFLRNENGHE